MPHSVIDRELMNKLTGGEVDENGDDTLQLMIQLCSFARVCAEVCTDRGLD